MRLEALVSRHLRASLSLLCFSAAQFTLAQSTGHEGAAQEKLTLVTIGEGKTERGHLTGFRIYAAPDGTTGKVTYTTGDSPQDAQQQIEDWIKLAPVVASREQHPPGSGQQISDRIVAQAISKTDSKTKIFIIIRRDNLNCYFIESPSMEVARQIESLIGETPDKRTPSP